ncbi:hypothetical protein [Halovivax asiaticus]|uniref:hypothetical protein n=1 Tax=Halovivax asiaticus TaxID=332953 RepID=UPI0012674517|nr:hypothetical protein [Halovivax asiaticus]
MSNAAEAPDEYSTRMLPLRWVIGIIGFVMGILIGFLINPNNWTNAVENLSAVGPTASAIATLALVFVTIEYTWNTRNLVDITHQQHQQWRLREVENWYRDVLDAARGMREILRREFEQRQEPVGPEVARKNGMDEFVEDLRKYRRRHPSTVDDDDFLELLRDTANEWWLIDVKQRRITEDTDFHSKINNIIEQAEQSLDEY